MGKTAIIIINWNGKHYIDDCIGSLENQRLSRDLYDIYVIDNASDDDSVSYLIKNYPFVKIIKNIANIGFSDANNIGIRLAIQKKYEYIWLLNNDTKTDRDCLNNLIEKANIFDPVILGHKIFFYPGNEYHKNRYLKKDIGKIIWYAGGLVDWENMYCSHLGVDEVDTGQYDGIKDTDFVTGCSMFMTRTAALKNGLFDPRYFMYLEDFDYCRRAKEKNIKVVYVSEPVIWHKNAGSSGGPGNRLHEYYMTRNRLFTGLRYAPLKTKLALFRESVKFLFIGSHIKKQAIIDAMLGRWGKQNAEKT